SSGISTAQRLTSLRALTRVIAGELEFAEIAESLGKFAAQQNDPRERRLIENLRGIFEWLARIDEQDRVAIREVLATIVKGQQYDLERFADPQRITSLRTAAELDEYTWLVAGCVGRFWTRLGFHHFPRFASRAPNEMTELGIDYGKGLQLINVLRDRPADLNNGRDYLPSDEVAASSADEVIQHWLARAEKGISAGIDYSASL